MYKVYCDKCRREIDHDFDGINLDFNHYGSVKFTNSVKEEHLNLCLACAQKVLKFIKEDKESEGEE